MGKVRLRINYESQEEPPFQAFLDVFRSQIGYDFQQLEIKRYWKIPAHLQAEIIVNTKAKSKEERVYEILQFANQLSGMKYRSGWVFNGPHDSMGLVFECYYNNHETDHPLKWAMIAVENE